jgi:hypothetical protein
MLILSTLPAIVFRNFQCQTGTWNGWISQTSCKITLWPLKLPIQYGNENVQICQTVGQGTHVLIICGSEDQGNIKGPSAWSNSKPTALTQSKSFFMEVLEVFLTISRHLCQDTISLLPNLHSNSDEMANQLFMLLPELAILRKQNKWGVWLQGIHVTMIVTVNTVGNLVLQCQYLKNFMQTGAPTASCGSTNPIVWSDERLFFV